MTTITTRAAKGSPLTHNEVDANFTNLNTDKIEGAASSTDNALVRFDSTTGKIAQNGVNIASDAGEISFPAVASPATAATNAVNILGTATAGGVRPGFVNERGWMQSVQADFARASIAIAQPIGNSATISTYGCTQSNLGTGTAKNTADTNVYTRTRGAEILQTVAAINNVCGGRLGNAQWSVGGGAAGRGGFRFHHIFGMATGVTALHRAFCGLYYFTGNPNELDPSGEIDIVGFGYDDTDTNCQFMHNDNAGTCTKIDLGASFPKPSADRTNVYDVEMYSPPGTTQAVYYRIVNRVSGAVASGTVTTNLPSTSTMLACQAYASISASAVIGILDGGKCIETLGTS